MASVPVSIHFPAALPEQQTPHSGVYGTSPGSASAGKHPSSGAGARKVYKRIQWDSSLDEKEWTVGVLKTREQAERKSGAEAWSLRVQSTVVEHSFTDFVAKYDRKGEEVPFHRIAWFKQNGVLVWEAEHLRHKIGDQHHPAHLGSGGSNTAMGLSVSPALGNSLLGCSPPTGSFMARLAAAAGGPMGPLAGPNVACASNGSFTGLPPRCNNSPLEGAAGQCGTPHQQHGWRPHRLSGTDISSGGSSSWCAGGAPLRETPSPWAGPGAAHVSFVNGHAPGGATSAGSSGHASHAHSGHVTPASLLGSSPSSSALPNGAAAGLSPALLGTSPHVVSGSWGAADVHSRSSSAGGVAGHLYSSARGAGPEGSGLSFMSASPAGSCSSSWTGTSPLAAAAAAGCSSLPVPGALRGLSSSSGGGGWPLGGGSLPAGGLAAAMAAAGAGSGAVVVPGVAPAELLMQEAEERELADYSQLPEKCWMDILQRLGVRELCCAARVNTTLRALTARSSLWGSAYLRLFGTPAPTDWSSPTVKRLCRRSELRASRWLEADVEARAVGFSGTWCCQLDESKVVSGDGCAVRLWAHESGRRIATLRGHSGRVTSVAFDDERILSGCSQGTVKLWSMDELKLSKTLRHHTGPVSATLLLRGMPISGSKDGMVCLWDANAPNSPIVVLEAGGPVHNLQLLEERDYLISGSNALGVWDMNTTQLLFTLDAPADTATSPGLSSSSSAASLAAAAGASVPTGAAAAAAQQDLEDDEELLQNGWLLQDDDSDSDLSDADDGPVAVGHAQQQQQQHAAGVAAVGAQGGSGGHRSAAATAPWTSISCHGNLLAAGNAAGVVLWDVRTQEAVGSIPAGGPLRGRAASHSSPNKRSGGSSSSSSLSCVGVQLDDWRLVTGFRHTGGGGGSSSGGGHVGGGGTSSSSSMNPCWWSGAGEALGEDGGPWGPRGTAGHSLEVYDIRAASSFSSAAAAAGGSAGGAGGASSGGGSAGLWTAAPVLSLPVPNRITCFQFHGQHLLVGQEGADCCLLSFHPPGSRSGHAAAAWGYGGAGGSRPGSCGYAAGMVAGASPGGVYMSSPGAGAQGYQGGEEAGGSGGGKKGKKGGTKVPAKKQTRYPKRATR